MSLATTVKESKLQRRMYTQKALWYRHNGDREGMRVCLNLSRVEVLNQRYFLGPCPFCGGAAHVASEADHPEYGSGGRFYFVRCGTCRARSGSKYAAPGNDCAIFYSEVRAEWNQRAKEATSE